MRYSKITYSIQWPIYWDKLDESKFITREAAEKRFHAGEFYFAVLWDESDEIIAIIDYSGTFVGLQIFQDGTFEGKPRKVPNAWSVYRAEPQGDYQHLVFCQYRYFNRHYSFRDGVARMRVTSEFLGQDKSYKGRYDESLLPPLSLSFDEYQPLFDRQADIQKFVDGIDFAEQKPRRRG